jgi:predicted DNA-binding ribbon-helix-helix protein
VAHHAIVVAGRKTSVTLEDAFWQALQDIAAERDTSPPALIASINAERQGNLSSAVRLFVLDYYRKAAGIICCAKISLQKFCEK